MANKAPINNQQHFDIVIVGAGLVGLAAAIALHAEGKRIALVDANDSRVDTRNQDWDTRIYALTPATETWLTALGVWPLMDLSRVKPVEAMALWHHGRQAADDPLILSAEDAHIGHMACIVENQNLMHALWQKLDSVDVTIMTGNACEDFNASEEAVQLILAGGEQISTSLLIAADGAHSFVRQQAGISTKQKAFKQKALVANYSIEKPHRDIARQWFAPHNILALLPLPNQQVSMVWSVATELADELLSLTPEALAVRVKIQSESVLGELHPVSETPCFALNQITAETLIADRVVLIGDAAHQVHPMAGQGANLGFRDVIALTEVIASAHTLQDIGELAVLRKYERMRKADILSMNTLTSGLDNLFATQSTIVAAVTSWGMSQLSQQQVLKRLLIKQAIA